MNESTESLVQVIRLAEDVFPTFGQGSGRLIWPYTARHTNTAKVNIFFQTASLCLSVPRGRIFPQGINCIYIWKL